MRSLPSLLVSVIIPGYKSDYILSTIESILAQTYPEIEIVVVDDGSPNQLEEKLSSLIKNGKIRYIYQTNQKMAAARNNGIRHASGDLIAFLDDDDIWLPEKIEKQVERFADPGVGLVYTFAEEFNDSGSIANSAFNHAAKGRIFNEIFLRDFIANSSVMVRKSCFDRVDMFNTTPEYFGVDDSDLWTRITYHYEADYVPEVLTKVRVHENRFSGNRVNMLLNDLNMRKKLISELDIPYYYARRYFHRIYFDLGYTLRRDQKLQAAGYFLRSFVNIPSLKTVLAIMKLPFYISRTAKQQT